MSSVFLGISAFQSAFLGSSKYVSLDSNTYEQQYVAFRGNSCRVLDSSAYSYIHRCNNPQLAFRRGILKPFFFRPKVVIYQPLPMIQAYPFIDEKNVEQDREVCEIQVLIGNGKGRSSATDVEIMVSLKPPDMQFLPLGFSCGWISGSGDRRLRRFFTISRLKLLPDDQETLFGLADTFDEHLLVRRMSIPQTLERIANIGYGIEGNNHVFLGGQCFKLPLKDYLVAIGLHNNEYGDLDTRYFHLDYEKWDQPNFHEVKLRFGKRFG